MNQASQWCLQPRFGTQPSRSVTPSSVCPVHPVPAPQFAVGTVNPLLPHSQSHSASVCTGTWPTAPLHLPSPAATTPAVAAVIPAVARMTPAPAATAAASAPMIPASAGMTPALAAVVPTSAATIPARDSAVPASAVTTAAHDSVIPASAWTIKTRQKPSKSPAFPPKPQKQTKTSN